MIKGGGTINNQISEAYQGGPGGKMGNPKNGSFYQSKYMSTSTNPMNQSPSPSQTFFKENPPMMMMMDTSKKTNGSNASNSLPGNQNNSSSFAGKKVMPNAYKNPKKLYVSPYS